MTRRREIAQRYDAAFKDCPALRPLSVSADREHGYHLYVVQLDGNYLTADRRQIFAALRAEDIGVNVHYLPVHFIPTTASISPPAPAYVPMPKRPMKRFFRCRFFPR